ncbi:methionyl-tRNA formyltransferase, partial [Candidatus Uhrbacteria bacterium]|nr:methionyl-tRNA formyltransferase [Candidatus Uhrbacteria bacterium]
IVPDTLFKYVNGKILPQEQNHEQATVVKMLSREDGLIDWMLSASAIERMVRAYTPWPGTYTIADGKRLKIFEARVGEEAGYPQMMCGDQTLLSLIRVQPEGKSVMDGREYLRGKKAGS